VWAFEKLADKKWGVIGEHADSHQAAVAPFSMIGCAYILCTT
jgi:hypothetical protein